MEKYNLYEKEINRYKTLGLKYTIYYDNELCEIGNLTEIEITTLLNKFQQNISFLPQKLLAEVHNLKDYLITLRRDKIIKLKQNIQNVIT